MKFFASSLSSCSHVIRHPLLRFVFRRFLGLGSHALRLAFFSSLYARAYVPISYFLLYLLDFCLFFSLERVVWLMVFVYNFTRALNKIGRHNKNKVQWLKARHNEQTSFQKKEFELYLCGLMHAVCGANAPHILGTGVFQNAADAAASSAHTNAPPHMAGTARSAPLALGATGATGT